MNLEQWPIEKVKPYERNPRYHDEEAINAVARSIREFGFRQPIVVDKEGVIVVGHARHEAAKRLGLIEVPIHMAEDLTPEQAKAYRIADNQLHLLSFWNYDNLVVEIQDLLNVDFDLSSLGFTADELERLQDPQAEQHEDITSIKPDPSLLEMGDKSEQPYQIVKVYFASPEAVKQFNELTGCDINEKTIAVWYPPKPRRRAEGHFTHEE